MRDLSDTSDSKGFQAGPWLGLAVLIGLIVLGFGLLSGSFTGFFGLPADSSNSVQILPSQFLSRAVYFEEAFTPKRGEYQIFEKASAFTGQPLSEMPRFFNVETEADIWSDLPPVPSDFSKIAYSLAVGRFFDIQSLSKGYYQNPEFYPNFTDPRGGLRYWLNPDPSSWVTNGFGTYPAEQSAILTRGKTERFETVVFMYSGYGAQTFQGVKLFADAQSTRFFDIEISPNTFVLEPNFPKFYREWAKRIYISGTLKPDTPPGNYAIAINVGNPPADLAQKWGSQYLNLYMNGNSGLRPSGNQIELQVRVE